MVRVDPQVIPVKEGSEGMITFVPIDNYGNLLGPGHADRIIIDSDAGQLSGDIIDNGDGFYFQKILSTGTAQSGNITVKIDGVEATTKPEINIGSSNKKFDISVHGGSAIPMGALADSFNTGLNVLVDIGYNFSSRLSLVGYFGYNQFKSNDNSIDDTYWLNLSLNVKYRGLLPPSSNTAWNYYIQAGPGYYIPKTGDSGFGANAGVGFNYELNSFLSLELGTDYHTVFDKDTDFWHLHAGLIFKF